MNAVIIVAGGTGSRMNTGLPKQLVEIHHKPIIVYSIEKFISFDKKIQVIVSLHKNYFTEFEKIKQQFHLNVQVVEGGETRYQSVKNALSILNDDIQLVGVHDAARPLVSLQTIEKTYEAAQQHGAAIPVIDVNESLREIENNTSKSVDRTKYKVVQTPQCFQKNILVEAYQMPYNPLFTDDASVVEKNGQKIYLTDGNKENIKITYPQDLFLAEMLLKL